MIENYHLGTTLKMEEWMDVLVDKEITSELNIAILQTMHSFEQQKASASQIGKILGYEGKNTARPLNLEIGRWGKRLVRKYPFELSVRTNGTKRKWDLFFDGETKNKFFIWQLKKELKIALEQLEWTGENQYAEEIPTEIADTFLEGAKRTITVNSYERNPLARQLCIEHYGAICSVCDFNFEIVYGKIGLGFIHVHHLTKLADIGKEYEINPLTDLRPVCPNCHAMLHQKKPPFTIDELKEIITSVNN